MIKCLADDNRKEIYLRRNLFFIVRVGTFDSHRPTVHRSRQSLLPRNPQTLAELDFDVMGERLDLPGGERFVLADTGSNDVERIVIFGSTKALETLCRCQQWHLDGTFSVTPFLFFQLFTVLGLFMEQVFPLVFALLPNKLSRTYERFFRMLFDILRSRSLSVPSSLVVISDFESGLISSIRVSLPFAVHRGCFFHYAQCIFRNVKSLGLSVRYRTDEDFRTKIRMFIALGLVPLQHFNLYVNNLFTYIANDRDILHFYTDYFFSTWLRPDFPRTLTNWYCVGYRTNNNAEAFNSRLSKRFRTNHPVIFRFSLELMKCHISDLNSIDTRLLGHAPPPPNRIYERLNHQILAIQANFETYPDPISYLRHLAHSTPQPDFNM